MGMPQAKDGAPYDVSGRICIIGPYGNIWTPETFKTYADAVSSPKDTGEG